MNTADLTLYITTSTVILTAIVGFVVPESAAYTKHNKKRLATRPAAQGSPAASSPPQGSPATSPSTASANGAVEAQLQRMQELQNAIAARLGVAATPAIPS
jgi:hypothetical protein